MSAVAQQFVSFLVDRIDAKVELLDGASNHETVEEVRLHIEQLRDAFSTLFAELETPRNTARRGPKKDE